MKTFKVTRFEKIREVQWVDAKNEDEAIGKMHYDNWDGAEVVSSEIESVEEVK